MWARSGIEVLDSARRNRGAPGAPMAQTLPALQPRLQELPARRRAAIKKAFKTIDQTGRGYVSLEEVQQRFGGVPSHSAAQQQAFKDALSRIAVPGPDSQSVITLAAFISHYASMSAGIQSDSEFEQVLQAQWGHREVNEILVAMQRQFAMVGLKCAFQDYLINNKELTIRDFEACFRRAGLQPRPDDLQRVFCAFSAPGAGIQLDHFTDQILAPRPETPAPVARGLPSNLALGGPALPPDLPEPTTAPLEVPPPGVGAPGASHPALMGAASQGGAPLEDTPMGVGPPAGTGPPAGGGGDIDAHLSRMEVELQNLKQAKASGASGPATSRMPAGPVSDADLDATLTRMEGHLHHVQHHTPIAQQTSQAPASSGTHPLHHSLAHHKVPDGPVNDAQLDAALSRMEGHLHHVQHHTPIAQQASQAPAPPPVDMPHWEHHKYGHHEITEPAWKAEANITDMYGHKHSSDEYHYSNFGAGAHGHHLAHYHLNDYHGLAHHSFQQQEYHKSTFGDAKHHGHWVPHLHGLGTAGHHGEHAYGSQEYQKHSFGKAGHHSHWVPHLHGIGN